MTAAQKTAKANFLKAIDYRKKTGVSLKEAFAKVYGKKTRTVAKKKFVPKKFTIEEEEKFKQIIAEAKKIRANNPDISKSQLLQKFLQKNVPLKKKVGAMSPENFDRMDGLTSITELRKFTYAAGAIIQDLSDEGFETYEIKEYLLKNLENILKRF